MTNLDCCTVERYKPGAEDDIVGLIQLDIQQRESQSVFSHDYWDWKYKNNFAGFFGHWIALARSQEDGRLAGHYTAIPVVLSSGGSEEKVAQSVDTMVHPDFRKQGIFVALANECYSAMKKDGVSMLYGYPNDASFPGFVNRLGWKHIFTAEELAYILNPKKVAKAKFSNVILGEISANILSLRSKVIGMQTKTKTKAKTNYQIAEHDGFDFDLNTINDWLGSRYKYYVNRDSHYLEWRYLKNPVDKNIVIRSLSKGEELKGSYVLKMKNYPHRGDLNVGHIMEFLIDPSEPELSGAVLADCVEVGKQKNADILHAYSHTAQHDFEHLKNFGFKKFDSKNYIIKLLADEKKHPGRTEPGNWYISLGDSDRA